MQLNHTCHFMSHVLLLRDLPYEIQKQQHWKLKKTSEKTQFQIEMSL